MNYKTADLPALRQRTKAIVEYVVETDEAVEVTLPKGRRVWLVPDSLLGNLSISCVGNFTAPPLPPRPVRKRKIGETDIVGEEFRRIGAQLYGVDWYMTMARALGLSLSAVKGVARRRAQSIPRRISRQIKVICAEAGIDWRSI